MVNVRAYINQHKNNIFDCWDKDYQLTIEYRKHTSDIFLCTLVNGDGNIKEKIVLKHYSDGRASLEREYLFSKVYEESFCNEENIKIPAYVHYDGNNHVAVTKYISDSVTLENYNLKNRTILKNSLDLKWYRLAGKWLAHFHKITSSGDRINISEECLMTKADKKEKLLNKWISFYPDPDHLRGSFEKKVKNTVANHRTVFRLSRMHREYGPGNIRLSSNDLYGLDFGISEMAFPYDDISYFIISCITKIYFPHHPFYTPITLDSDEIKAFISGYLEHYSITDHDPLGDPIFYLFLWKNLIRAMSGRLARASKLVPLKRYVIRKYLYCRYKKVEELIVSHL